MKKTWEILYELRNTDVRKREDVVLALESSVASWECVATGGQPKTDHLCDLFVDCCGCPVDVVTQSPLCKCGVIVVNADTCDAAISMVKFLKRLHSAFISHVESDIKGYDVEVEDDIYE